MGTRITGCGKAQPGLIVQNESLEKIVDTSDEWIFTRTGIKERRISVNESCLDLAHAACLKAQGLPEHAFDDQIDIDSDGKARKALPPEDIDLIVFTTITPDTLVPSAASALKKRLGATNAIAFDINAACTGFVYGLSVVESMMAASNSTSGIAAKSRPIKHALLVSSERMSRLTNWQDRNTCVLFGDGAGAMALEWSDGESDVLSMYLENTDDEDNVLTCLQQFDSLLPFDSNGVIFNEEELLKSREQATDSKIIDYSYINSLGLESDPATTQIRDSFDMSIQDDNGGPAQYVSMNGQKVFKFASKAMESAVRHAADLANVKVEDIDLFVPHQANYRIIEYASKRLKMPIDRFQISIEKTGNSSSSCLPMALSDAFVQGRIHEGSIVCLVAFGGGLTSGAAILRF